MENSAAMPTRMDEAAIARIGESRHMAKPELIALLCTISRGGFTDERIFRVKLADDGTHVGACPRQYCYKRSGRLLKEDEPSERGKTIEGLVLARYVREAKEGVALVSVPDGAVVSVRPEQIREAPKEFSPDVPVQP
jgi:hypothetical protein